ncbi:MAG: hypothetical protein K2X77_13515 [Candidatus Obscuribacterales bacterium]|nr:hypothetical protein [Candidatus Obscuribacterales bacterium]
MSQRKKDGATLALVIILAFVLIIVGGCFFVWQLLVGGGKELQHATDSGNLNVAKQALITPDVVVPDSDSPFTNTNLRKEFEEVLEGGTKVNLLNFNRLVAKAVLAQLNAQAEGTAQAKANAIALTQAVYDLGSQLQSKLDSSSSLKGHFEQLSNSNSVRMLQHPTQTSAANAVAHRDAEYQTSYMARGKASNVYFEKGAFPPSAPLPDSDMVADAGNKVKTYLKGYSAISSASNLVGCPTTWAVPLRPGEQPHLVSVDDFTSKVAPPFPNAIANSFKSGGSASFIRTGSDLELRSCAIVGVLEKVFPAIQSGGTIIVDNAGRSFSGDIDDPGNSELFKPGGKLMSPKGVDVFEVTCLDPNGHFTDGKKTHKFMCHYDPPADQERPSQFIINNAKTTINSGIEGNPEGKNGVYDRLRTFHDSDSSKSNQTMEGEDYWAMKMHDQTRYVSQWPDRNRIMGVSGGSPGTTLSGKATKVTPLALCNGSSFEPNGQPPGTASPSECNKMDDFAKLCNGQLNSKGGGGQNYENLMLLEQYILEIIGGFGSGGCVTVAGYGPVGGCGEGFVGSGMKHIDTGGVPFSEANIGVLLQDTTRPDDMHNGRPVIDVIREDMSYRIKQIVQGANPGSIIDGDPLPFNKVLYIHKGNNGQVVIDEHKPATLQYTYNPASVVDPIKKIPDGQMVRGRRTIGVSGTWVPGFMWECGGGQSSGISASVVKWYPSSGKGGLLGVLQLMNCPEANGPDWCCP